MGQGESRESRHTCSQGNRGSNTGSNTGSNGSDVQEALRAVQEAMRAQQETFRACETQFGARLATLESDTREQRLEEAPPDSLYTLIACGIPQGIAELWIIWPWHLLGLFLQCVGLWLVKDLVQLALCNGECASWCD